MRILILGVSGLIGHKIFQVLSEDFEVFGTLHKSKKDYGNLELFSSLNIIENINVAEFEILKGVLYAINPDVILNCVGITKRKIETYDLVDVLTINSLFPHQLANWAKINKKRVIHFSTDCVFNGRVGNYTETSLTTAEDVYGRTKALGEINYKHTLTIRSSFIGQELFDKTELLEWFLNQNGKQINGYTNTLYSGVSTIFMARIVKYLILKYPYVSGLYNLSPNKPISKYDLLCLAKKFFNINVEIIPTDKPIHLPTLDGSKLKSEINLTVPDWEEMMSELALNKSFYLNL
jgi:dTDP-4-dehydrorhamnose reductase